MKIYKLPAGIIKGHLLTDSSLVDEQGRTFQVNFKGENFLRKVYFSGSKIAEMEEVPFENNMLVPFNGYKPSAKNPNITAEEVKAFKSLLK